MSWDSATGVLYMANPTVEQIDSLSQFVVEHADELRRCYAPEFADQRPTVSKFVSRLFVLLERQEIPDTEVDQRLAKAVEQAADLLTREDFFKGVFHYALMESDVSLLELVYSSLFTEIVFNSSLTSLWFKERLEAERLQVKPSRVAQALNILISVQFLDIRQDWSAVKPGSELLLSIQKYIGASKDAVLKLVWTLALYYMAQQHYSNENDDDGIDIEPLMRELQTRAGVHWSQVIKDQLQVSLVGLESLVISLETIRKYHSLQFVSSQLFAQTVADVVSCLFTVSKPTESLCAALASAVEPCPALQRVPWIPVQHLALIKSKCPSSIGSLVSTAQVLDLGSRIDFLSEMRTYVCAVDASCLDLDENSLENPVLGSDVRTKKIVSVLPPRVTDHQGTLELAQDTRGTLLACDGTECLVMWYFTYNGWSLLGRIFENADLLEQTHWKPLTVELLKLVSITVDVGVLTAMSAGLARGDIVDLIAKRLQSWIHSGIHDHCGLAFDFLVQFALIDPPRVWTLLNLINWSADPTILHGIRRLILAVWPTFDPKLSLHTHVMKDMVELFGSQYLLTSDVSILDVFELFLPHSSYLMDDLLSPSPLRDITVAPLLANLNQAKVLNFCKYCIEITKKKPFEEEGSVIGFSNLPEESALSLSFAVSSSSSSSLSPVSSIPNYPLASSTAPSSDGSGSGSSKRLPQSYLERQLFAKSSEITSLFVSNNKSLRKPILELWTAMVDNTEAPPLLAFLNEGQASQLKDELVAISLNKLEASETVGSLARFLIAAERQESLLDLLREPLLPLIEDRLQSIEDPESLYPLLASLKLVKGSLKPATLAILEKKTSDENYEVADHSLLNVKRVAIELLTKQIKTNPEPLHDFIKKVEELTPKIVVLYGARPSLYLRLLNNLKTKWPAITSEDIATNTFELNLSDLDSKLNEDPIWKKSYRPEVLEVINNGKLVESQTKVVSAWCQLMITSVKSSSQAVGSCGLSKWVKQLLGANSNTLPVSLQRAEDERTSAALVILQDPRCEKSVELLNDIYHQLTDLTMSPSAGLPIMKPRLKNSMNMAVLVLSKLSESDARADVQLAPILLGLLDVVVIKQLQIFGASEDTLQLHLLILSHCLRILKGSEHKPQGLVQAMIESGSDSTILNAFVNTPVHNPWRGELILTYVQEWLRSRIMTDTFVRNGLMNILIDAPLSRLIQNGGIVASTHPELHSLWRRGVLPTVAHLLQELDFRVGEETWLFIENYAFQIATCLDQWKFGQISMALIDETWVLCTILRSVYQPNTDKLGLRFDEEELAKTIDVLLSHQKYLVSRTVPITDVDNVIKEMRVFREWLHQR